MNHNSFTRRLFALLIAFSFLPLLISGNDSNRTRNNLSSDLGAQNSITCDVYRFAVVICAEELLPSGTARLTRYDTSRKFIHPRRIYNYSKGNTYLLFAASVLFIILFLVYRRIYGSRRFIIKYIHDQDGHKI